MKVLVADDDPVSRFFAQGVLRDLGHECRTAADGDEAWALFHAWRPAVVLSDLVMPGLTGVELCARVRSDAGSYTYFIMLSSEGGLEETLKGMRAGVDDYLVKPLAPGDLHARLIAAARVTALHADLAAQRVALERLNRGLTSDARRDSLTGLGNRRALSEDLAILEARVHRYGHRYCLAMLDVDHFKSYNDRYGHPAGDAALRVVAGELTAAARSGDTVYRYGGEEFLCIFPEQSVATGSLVVERMRSGLAERAIPHAGSPLGILTITAGLAVFEAGSARSADAVVDSADAAMYRGKQLGRNRVAHASAV
ncbi:MAG: hypothetical protein QOE35_186 [Actinomycetota bacterium]|jgi:two-component system chemotaxis response regulator CheY